VGACARAGIHSYRLEKLTKMFGEVACIYMMFGRRGLETKIDERNPSCLTYFGANVCVGATETCGLTTSY
jgi:hypothetical protein